MHRKLESKYLHSDYISTMQIELLASKQDFLTVDIYTDKFQELNICAKVNEDDLIWVNHYQGRIASGNSAKDGLFDFKSISEIYQKVHMVD